MASTRRKIAQELAARIVNTRGVVVGDRGDARRLMGNIAFDTNPIETPAQKLVLCALQVAARDDQIFTAIIAARAALGK